MARDPGHHLHRSIAANWSLTDTRREASRALFQGERLVSYRVSSIYVSTSSVCAAIDCPAELSGTYPDR